MQTLQRKIMMTIMAVVILLSFAPIQPMALAEGDDYIVLKEGDEGDDVINLQSRLMDLGYYNYKKTNYFGGFTKKALAAFQKENGLSSDGVLGQKTFDVLYSNQAKRKPVKAVVKPRTSSGGSSSSGGRGTSKKGQMLDWWKTVSKMFSKGETAKVIDVETGIEFYVKRYGGTNHADCEPKTKRDMEKMKKTRGGEWSWERRAIIVKIDGKYIAASCNGQPHGGSRIKDNGFNGHFCIHFLNSKTHIHDATCPQHQAMVRKAAGK